MLDIGSDPLHVGNPHEHEEPELYVLPHVYLWFSFEYLMRRSATSEPPYPGHEPL